MKAMALEKEMLRIEKDLRTIILIEICFPMVLLIFGIYHGLIQVLDRSGIVRGKAFLGIDYYKGLTLHGAINAVVFTTFFAVAFGHSLIRQLLGRTPNLKAAWASMISMVTGTLLVAIPVFAGYASVLYTFYPPLKAHPVFYIGLVLLVVGSWIAFYSWIPLYLSWRKENPDRKVPLAVLGVFSTFTVWQIATIPVAVEIIFLLIPWSIGWVKTVNVPLARMLFWGFGHALVYFWVLPAYVMYYSVLPRLCGGKLYSDFAGRFTFMWFIVFSAPIGIHHQYTEPGINTTWKFLHAFLTMLVALPSLVTAFTVSASMEHGSKQSGGFGIFNWWTRLPFADEDRWLFGYFFAGLVIFIFGGITGIVNASYNMDNVVHNTSWLPAHFHQTVGGPVFLAFTGMSLFLVSQLTGKAVRFKGYNVWVPYLWLLGVMIFSTGLFVGGVGGEPRRTNMGLTYTNPQSPLYRADWAFAKILGSLGGSIMAASMVIYFIVFFATLFGKKESEPGLGIPVSEAYHNEELGVMKDIKPWLIGAIVLWAVSYAPPLIELARSGFEGAQAFLPGSPVPNASW